MDMYLEIKRKFEKNKDDENARKMSKYMRNLFLFYGLPTPKRRALYKDFLKDEIKKKIINWDLLDRYFEDEHREFQYFVIDYLSKMQKILNYDDLKHINIEDRKSVV